MRDALPIVLASLLRPGLDLAARTGSAQMRHAKWAEAAVVLAIFIVASRDVDRTMRQDPIDPKQQQQFFDRLAQQSKGREQ